MATARSRVTSTPHEHLQLASAPPPTANAVAEFEVTSSEIASEAYSLFEARGGEHGHDVEDWLAAEALVRQRYLNRKQPE